MRESLSNQHNKYNTILMALCLTFRLAFGLLHLVLVNKLLSARALLDQGLIFECFAEMAQMLQYMNDNGGH